MTDWLVLSFDKWNYDGGDALDRLNGRVPPSATCPACGSKDVDMETDMRRCQGRLQCANCNCVSEWI